MTQGITESDWKLFRKLHPVLVERFCERILHEVDAVVADDAKTFHQRYRDIFELIEHRDKELANAFDDLRRSTALMQIFAVYGRGLLTDDELNGFSQGLVNIIKSLTNERPA